MTGARHDRHPWPNHTGRGLGRRSWPCAQQRWQRHALTHGFAVLGYHGTGSTGTLFLYGIVVGASMLGLSLLLAGARRTSRRGRASRHDLEQSRRETAAVSQQRDDLLNRAEAAPPDTAKGQEKG